MPSNCTEELRKGYDAGRVRSKTRKQHPPWPNRRHIECYSGCGRLRFGSEGRHRKRVCTSSDMPIMAPRKISPVTHSSSPVHQTEFYYLLCLGGVSPFFSIIAATRKRSGISIRPSSLTESKPMRCIAFASISNLFPLDGGNGGKNPRCLSLASSRIFSMVFVSLQRSKITWHGNTSKGCKRSLHPFIFDTQLVNPNF